MYDRAKHSCGNCGWFDGKKRLDSQGNCVECSGRCTHPRHNSDGEIRSVVNACGSDWKPCYDILYDPVEEFLSRDPLPRKPGFDEWRKSELNVARKNRERFWAHYPIIIGTILIIFGIIIAPAQTPIFTIILVFVLGAALAGWGAYLAYSWMKKAKAEDERGYNEFAKRYKERQDYLSQ